MAIVFSTLNSKALKSYGQKKDIYMILLKDSAPEELLGGIFEMQSGRNSQ